MKPRGATGVCGSARSASRAARSLHTFAASSSTTVSGVPRRRPGRVAASRDAASNTCPMRAVLSADADSGPSIDNAYSVSVLAAKVVGMLFSAAVASYPGNVPG